MLNLYPSFKRLQLRTFNCMLQLITFHLFTRLLRYCHVRLLLLPAALQP